MKNNVVHLYRYQIKSIAKYDTYYNKYEGGFSYLMARDLFDSTNLFPPSFFTSLKFFMKATLDKGSFRLLNLLQRLGSDNYLKKDLFFRGAFSFFFLILLVTCSSFCFSFGNL